MDNNIQSLLAMKGAQIFGVSEDTTVLEAVEKMCSLAVGALLVMRAEKPVGIFSERDLMTRVVLKKRDPASTKVSEVMTTNLIYTSTQQKISEAMAMMTEKHFRHLPVIDDAGELKGMISIGDMVRAISAAQAQHINILEDYISGKHMA